MKKNSPEIWDDVWDMYSDDYLMYLIEHEKIMLKYRKIMKIINKKFTSLKGLNIIEIGAGIGVYSILLARMGANVTILDYSNKALEFSKKIFEHYKLKANFINANALNISKNLRNKFDISMSYGLSEHFIGKDRVDIFKSHLELLKTEGLFINQIPNKKSIPYRIHMYLMNSIGKWPYGEEYPFTKKEINDIMHKINQKEFKIEGDGFLNSLDFLNVFRLINKKWSLRHIPFFQQETLLDSLISYSHIVWGAKEK